MKKSITENKNMTFTDIIKLYIYRPYNDVLKIMVDDDECNELISLLGEIKDKDIVL